MPFIIYMYDDISYYEIMEIYFISVDAKLYQVNNENFINLQY